MNNPDALIGQQLGNILVQEPLGRGGMARVYKGLDTSLRRPVAIKVIAEGLRQSNVYAQRFEREAQAVANLKHPNIVTVFQFGKTGNLFYLVMEFVDGVDLDAILRNYENNGELMPHADVLRILQAIGSALDYAHSQGVIHRDVKPSNIMLERDGRPVLTDFGLALRVSEGTIGDTFGSPHYVAPEQARSSANAVPQSDLYSLGVVAYELLTGIVPFDDPSPAAIAMQHLTAEIPSPRALNRNLSEQVEQVLLTALAKEPVDRYPTCAAFVEALQAAISALKAHPVSVRTSDLPPLPAGMTPPPPRRLSMQTAQDKLEQELAITHARGQATTKSVDARSVRSQRAPRSQSDIETEAGRTAPASARPEPGGRRGLVFLIAGLATLAILVIAGLALSGVLRGASSPSLPTVAALPTLPNMLVPTITATLVPSTATSAPTSTTGLTATVPTLAPPTALPTIAPTQGANPAGLVAPPTANPASPTPIPPTATALIPANGTVGTATITATITPTILYPNGRPFVFEWDDVTFYGANVGPDNILSSSFILERILVGGGYGQRYLGSRWGAYYPYVEVKHCVILKASAAYGLPSDCPYGINANVKALSDELFWTPASNSVAFRVLWGNQEIARCQIVDKRCVVMLPSK